MFSLLRSLTGGLKRLEKTAAPEEACRAWREDVADEGGRGD